MGISKALVVDDSRLARVALTKLLAKRGLEVDTAASGSEALEYLRDASPDVVFVDYMMPDMDGFQAAESINQLRSDNALPLVMYTSQDTPEDRRRARDLGICGFLTKPTSEEGLDAVLDQVDSWHAGNQTAVEPDADDDGGDEDDPLPEDLLAGLEEFEAEIPEPAPHAGSAPGAVSPKSRTQSVATEAAPVKQPVSGAGPVTARDDGTPATPTDDERRIRDIADQTVKDVLADVRGEWQQQLHQVAAELQDMAGESAALAGQEVSDRLARETLAEMREEWERLQGEWRKGAEGGAERTAKGIADSVARSVAEEVAESVARRVTAQLLEELDGSSSGAAMTQPREEDLEDRVSAALQSVVNELGSDQNFQSQVVAVVSDQGVPLLKNALDHWVRRVARETAEQTVRDAVIRGTEAVIQETVVASAQAAAREVHAMGRKGRIAGISAWVVLAAGVVLALVLAV